MKKIVVLYNVPEDEQAFFAYYKNVHLPLANKTPGIVGVELTKIGRTLVGSPGAFFLVELLFADEATLEAAMKTPEFAATGADTHNFATGGVTVMMGSAVEM